MEEEGRSQTVVWALEPFAQLLWFPICKAIEHSGDILEISKNQSFAEENKEEREG